MAANGYLSMSELTFIDGGYLENNTARAWRAFCDDVQSQGYKRPTWTQPDGFYRTFARQVFWKSYWTNLHKPGNAATPGWSNHGIGRSVDIFNVYQYPREMLVRTARKYGFIFNVPSELWHMWQNGTHVGGGFAGGISTPIELGDDMPSEAWLKQLGADIIDQTVRGVLKANVTRASGKVTLIQEIADAKSGTMRLEARGVGYPFVIYNTDDKNESTRRALVGELSFQPLAVGAAAEERKAASVVNVNQTGWDRYKLRAQARQIAFAKTVGLNVADGALEEINSKLDALPAQVEAVLQDDFADSKIYQLDEEDLGKIAAKLKVEAGVDPSTFLRAVEEIVDAIENVPDAVQDEQDARERDRLGKV